ncbi:hypothetical protein LO772_33495 [Yinghuangia sp. ASG 101]|uniref:hypothetical protein n=1 Tax=Yinghuangia sp. ASG 101 TaxID=2896848 RepID=UPI001E3E6233|nr:hypothetical protein [Yinghuangia sp. ASG 101]UGQ11634.1 hypothetical protein LO772_33495 [Yinghuangia sp. ASG 101]
MEVQHVEFPAEHGRAIRLFDGVTGRLVFLPPPTGMLTLRLPWVAPEVRGLGQERLAAVADALLRFLVWKGYRVGVRYGFRGPYPREGGPFGIDVLGQPEGSAGPVEPLCRVVVGPVEVHGACHHDGAHRTGRVPTVADVVGGTLTAADVRFALLVAGHHRHPRRFRCADLHAGHGLFQDARVARRRLRLLVARMQPRPAPSFPALSRPAPPPPPLPHTYAAAMGGTPSTEAHWRGTAPALRRCDDALSRGLNVPLAFGTLYGSLRHGAASPELAGAAQALLPLGVGGDSGGGSPPSIGPATGGR